MNFKSKFMIPVTMATLILFGCYGGGSDESGSAGGTDGDSGSSDTDTLHLAITDEIPTLKTNGEMDGLSQTMIQNIFEGLYRKDKDDEITEGIAEDYEKDGDTYTFTLREDAKWSNGDPVTADDFIYAWKKALHPDTF